MPSPRNRVVFFLALCVACALGLGIYFVRSSRITPLVRPALTVAAQTVTAGAGAPPRRIFFRYAGVDENYGKLAVVDYSALGAPRFIDGLSCEAVYFAGGNGICLTADRGVFTTYAARIFDANFATRFTLPLKGGPSRTRVSADGTLGGFTVFVSGHGYASLDFSTQTLLIGMATGKVLASLEDFKVTKDGQPFAAKDFNFWGVTFTPDPRRFYCTLSSNRKLRRRISPNKCRAGRNCAMFPPAIWLERVMHFYLSERTRLPLERDAQSSRGDGPFSDRLATTERRAPAHASRRVA